MTAIDDAVGSVRSDVPERWRLGQYFVPKTRYIDPDFLRLECERVFPRTWLPACRLEEIAGVGDYVEFNVVGESILVVREAEGSVRAFFNSCRHRGTRLARGRGRVGNLRCPFHAWQYGLDGSNLYVHDEEDFGQLTKDYLCLRRCQVGQWCGWVFINLDGTAEPLQRYLAPLPDRLAILNIAAMRYKWRKTFVMPCNWKTALDGFSESYHLPGTHPQLIRGRDRSLRPLGRRELVGDPSYAPSEALGDHVARYFVEPRDPARPRYADRDSLLMIAKYFVKEIRALQNERDVWAIEQLAGDAVPEGPALYDAYRQALRERAVADGLDWPVIPPEIRQKAEGYYTVFPNMAFLVRQGNLLGYQALPNGSDPDSCIFDAYALELFPPDEIPEFKPEFYTDWRQGDVGEVLSQDFSNFEDVTVGLHSSAFEGATLNPRQEVPVFHRQVVLDEYIFGSAPQRV
jgi:phenylpropionate dioxygenase-like ring-hydroxylating dioxygenase large terminal subunit